MTKIPQRFIWATKILGMQPDETVLEIGCGAGILVQCIAEKITTGSITALDQSEAMIEKARKRNDSSIMEKKAILLNKSLANFKTSKRFDKIVAFNVNFFWKNSAEEFKILQQILKPGGYIFAFFEVPYNDSPSSFTSKVSSIFKEHLFIVVKKIHAEFKSRGCVCLIAQRPVK